MHPSQKPLPSLFIFLVMLFFILLPGIEVLFAQDHPREISFGLTARELRQKSVEYAQKKYMPIDVCTHYFKQGQIAIAAIWEYSPTADFKFRAGLLRADMKKAISEFGSDGYRLIHFTGTGQGGEERYTGIWIRKEGQKLYARYGIPLDELVKLNEKFVMDGYSILRLAAFEEKGQLLFTAIWDNPIVSTRILDHQLSQTKFRKKVEQRIAEGFRLVQIIPYFNRKRMNFSAIWEPSRGRKQKFDDNITRLVIRKTEKKMAAKNFSPQSIAAYRWGRKDSHMMIWEENSASQAKKSTKKKARKIKPLFPIK